MRLSLAIWPLAAAALVLPCAAQVSPAPDAFTSREKGYCTACHQVPAGAGPASRADLGPALSGERMRALGRARIREIIEDPTRANPETMMPPYGRHRILDTAEIQRIVEYLHALP